MCGIAGIFCFEKNDYNTNEYGKLVKRMTDRIAHRGPDGEGHLILDNGRVFLGHRRLAIIDLSDAARQPMQSLDGRYIIVYNGELYNYIDLRKELIDLQYKFFSNSDTEVILNSYSEWGEECLNRFNGIFSFAIWDEYEKCLFLACDRYGTKPLYYAVINGQFVFASEYKSIIIHPDFTKNIDFCALKQYFTFQNIFDNRTFYKGIRMLNPGSYLTVHETEPILKEKKYWEFDFTEESSLLSDIEYERQLDHLFHQAVKRQLMSDVPVGSYLSGGIDSGSITAIASTYVPIMKTFTCGFDLHSASGVELVYDEREKAEYMSYCFKTEQYEMVLKSGDMERCIHDLVWHLEDPRVGQSYPNYYMSKLSSQFVKVVLAGTGGDELFGGYPWRYYRVANCDNMDQYIDSYYLYWQRLLNETDIENVFEPLKTEMSDFNMKDVFKSVFLPFKKKLTMKECINESLFFEAKTFLRGLLIVEDKLSMAHGLETRVPFLDNDLVDFAMHLPVRFKLSNLSSITSINENDYERKQDKYYRETNDGKMLLRKVMNKYIPKEIVEGKKQGFSAPDASWFKGESIDFVRSIVENKNSKIYDYMDYKAINSLVNRHLEGRENKRLLIWSLINFEEWLNQYGT